MASAALALIDQLDAELTKSYSEIGKENIKLKNKIKNYQNKLAAKNREAGNDDEVSDDSDALDEAESLRQQLRTVGKEVNHLRSDLKKCREHNEDALLRKQLAKREKEIEILHLGADYANIPEKDLLERLATMRQAVNECNKHLDVFKSHDPKEGQPPPPSGQESQISPPFYSRRDLVKLERELQNSKAENAQLLADNTKHAEMLGKMKSDLSQKEAGLELTAGKSQGPDGHHGSIPKADCNRRMREMIMIISHQFRVTFDLGRADDIDPRETLGEDWSLLNEQFDAAYSEMENMRDQIKDLERKIKELDEEKNSLGNKLYDCEEHGIAMTDQLNNLQSAERRQMLRFDPTYDENGHRSQPTQPTEEQVRSVFTALEQELDTVRNERDDVRGQLADMRKERDVARLEADNLRRAHMTEVARVQTFNDHPLNDQERQELMHQNLTLQTNLSTQREEFDNKIKKLEELSRDSEASVTRLAIQSSELQVRRDNLRRVAANHGVEILNDGGEVRGEIVGEEYGPPIYPPPGGGFPGVQPRLMTDEEYEGINTDRNPRELHTMRAIAVRAGAGPDDPQIGHILEALRAQLPEGGMPPEYFSPERLIRSPVVPQLRHLIRNTPRGLHETRGLGGPLSSNPPGDVSLGGNEDESGGGDGFAQSRTQDPRTLYERGAPPSSNPTQPFPSFSIPPGENPTTRGSEDEAPGPRVNPSPFQLSESNELTDTGGGSMGRASFNPGPGRPRSGAILNLPSTPPGQTGINRTGSRSVDDTPGLFITPSPPINERRGTISGALLIERARSLGIAPLNYRQQLDDQARRADPNDPIHEQDSQQGRQSGRIGNIGAQFRYSFIENPERGGSGGDWDVVHMFDTGSDSIGSDDVTRISTQDAANRDPHLPRETSGGRYFPLHHDLDGRYTLPTLTGISSSPPRISEHVHSSPVRASESPSIGTRSSSPELEDTPQREYIECRGDGPDVDLMAEDTDEDTPMEDMPSSGQDSSSPNPVDQLLVREVEPSASHSASQSHNQQQTQINPRSEGRGPTNPDENQLRQDDPCAEIFLRYRQQNQVYAQLWDTPETTLRGMPEEDMRRLESRIHSDSILINAIRHVNIVNADRLKRHKEKFERCAVIITRLREKRKDCKEHHLGSSRDQEGGSVQQGEEGPSRQEGTSSAQGGNGEQNPPEAQNQNPSQQGISSAQREGGEQNLPGREDENSEDEVSEGERTKPVLPLTVTTEHPCAFVIARFNTRILGLINILISPGRASNNGPERNMQMAETLLQGFIAKRKMMQRILAGFTNASEFIVALSNYVRNWLPSLQDHEPIVAGESVGHDLDQLKTFFNRLLIEHTQYRATADEVYDALIKCRQGHDGHKVQVKELERQLAGAVQAHQASEREKIKLQQDHAAIVQQLAESNAQRDQLQRQANNRGQSDDAKCAQIIALEEQLAKETMALRHAQRKQNNFKEVLGRFMVDKKVLHEEGIALRQGVIDRQAEIDDLTHQIQDQAVVADGLRGELETAQRERDRFRLPHMAVQHLEGHVAEMRLHAKVLAAELSNLHTDLAIERSNDDLRREVETRNANHRTEEVARMAGQLREERRALRVELDHLQRGENNAVIFQLRRALQCTSDEMDDYRRYVHAIQAELRNRRSETLALTAQNEQLIASNNGYREANKRHDVFVEDLHEMQMRLLELGPINDRYRVQRDEAQAERDEARRERDLPIFIDNMRGGPQHRLVLVSVLRRSFEAKRALEAFEFPAMTKARLYELLLEARAERQQQRIQGRALRGEVEVDDEVLKTPEAVEGEANSGRDELIRLLNEEMRERDELIMENELYMDLSNEEERVRLEQEERENQRLEEEVEEDEQAREELDQNFLNAEAMRIVGLEGFRPMAELGGEIQQPAAEAHGLAAEIREQAQRFVPPRNRANAGGRLGGIPDDLFPDEEVAAPRIDLNAFEQGVEQAAEVLEIAPRPGEPVVEMEVAPAEQVNAEARHQVAIQELRDELQEAREALQEARTKRDNAQDYLDKLKDDWNALEQQRADLVQPGGVHDLLREEVRRQRDEAFLARDEAIRERDVAVHERDNLRDQAYEDGGREIRRLVDELAKTQRDLYSAQASLQLRVEDDVPRESKLFEHRIEELMAENDRLRSLLPSPGLGLMGNLSLYDQPNEVSDQLVPNSPDYPRILVTYASLNDAVNTALPDSPPNQSWDDRDNEFSSDRPSSAGSSPIGPAPPPPDGVEVRVRRNNMPYQASGGRRRMGSDAEGMQGSKRKERDEDDEDDEDGEDNASPEKKVNRSPGKKVR